MLVSRLHLFSMKFFLVHVCRKQKDLVFSVTILKHSVYQVEMPVNYKKKKV